MLLEISADACADFIVEVKGAEVESCVQLSLSLLMQQHYHLSLVL